jgi:hypothetical protein
LTGIHLKTIEQAMHKAKTIQSQQRARFEAFPKVVHITITAFGKQGFRIDCACPDLRQQY